MVFARQKESSIDLDAVKVEICEIYTWMFLTHWMNGAERDFESRIHHGSQPPSPPLLQDRTYTHGKAEEHDYRTYISSNSTSLSCTMTH
jgi:hypothetical protein